MKAIIVMFDSLNRHQLQPYGCDWTMTPNFRRLAERAVTFDRSYVCSMPCMPARRDFHTGRPNFLHRSWGPLEPFDDSVPEMLHEIGVHTHLTTDHYHYFEDGGCTYHTRYSTWQFHRGQEGDPWIGQVADPAIPQSITPTIRPRNWRQDWINRSSIPTDAEHCQTRTFRDGLDFIDLNRNEDRWLLQIETFDPHEPFFSHRKWKDLFAEHYDGYDGPHFDWPPYRHVEEAPHIVEHLRVEYAALLAKCDAHLGDVLDRMDQHNLWDDTMLIVWTDHGLMLGEHQMYAKVWMPFYEEIAHTPFFVWDPRGRRSGERRRALVQPSIDLPVTLLNYFGLAPTRDMLGRDLASTVADDGPVREAAIFGIHGGHVNVTDGRHVYMRGAANADNEPLYEYTHMPTHLSSRIDPTKLCDNIELSAPFAFTKGCRTMRIRTDLRWTKHQMGEHLLFDTKDDPKQHRPLADPQIESRMKEHLLRLMVEADAPPEQYERLGLERAV